MPPGGVLYVRGPFVKRAGVFFALLMLFACGGQKRAAVTDLEGREGLSMFSLVALRGMRDAERLDAQAVFSDSSSILTVELRFAIGAPTKLVRGSWNWARGRQTAGTVAARSVTFLGGQNGPPSIGGAFELLDAAGKPRYLVTIPVTEVRTRR